jgi:phosphate transport system protein
MKERPKMSHHLQKEIAALKEKIIYMGTEVEDRVYRATVSLINRNEKMAEAVLAGDHEIDLLEVTIEEDCLKLLALHQPVANDLRFIISVLKINSDLERVGDLAVGIAERSLYLIDQPPTTIPFDMSAMMNTVESMLTRSIEALVNQDVEKAHRVRAEDDRVDAMNREMYALVTSELAKDPEHINVLLQNLSISRHLERIADHASNIAEDVIYMVNAEIVRHTPEVLMDEQIQAEG